MQIKRPKTKKYNIVLILVLILCPIISYIIVRLTANTTITIKQAEVYTLLVVLLALVTSLAMIIMAFICTRQNQKLIKQKNDSFLMNEQDLYLKLNEVIELYSNYGISHSVILMNITYHGTNTTLYEIVRSLEEVIRKNDTLFRMASGYFVIVANCDLQDAVGLGNKLVKKMADLREELETAIDISIGITQTKNKDSKANIISRVTKSAEAARKYGKDKVEYMN